MGVPPIDVQDWKKLNVVLNRILRRTSMSSTGLLSPAFFSLYAKAIGEDGIVGKFLFPCAGSLTQVCISVPGVSKEKEAAINIELSDGGVASPGLTIATKKPYVENQIKYEIERGMILTVRINNTSFTDVLFAALFTPHLKHFKAISYLNDVIEEKASERVRSALDSDVPSGA